MYGYTRKQYVDGAKPRDISHRSRTQEHEYFRVMTEGLACSGQLLVSSGSAKLRMDAKGLSEATSRS